MTASEGLAGRRILVVEDDMLIALYIEEALHDLGCIVVGPASSLDRALQLAKTEQIEAAVLDVNIRGGQVFPVAESLDGRGIPYILASGYGDWVLPSALQGRLRLTKPFTTNELETKLQAVCRPVANPGDNRSPP